MQNARARIYVCPDRSRPALHLPDGSEKAIHHQKKLVLGIRGEPSIAVESEPFRVRNIAERLPYYLRLDSGGTQRDIMLVEPRWIAHSTLRDEEKKQYGEKAFAVRSVTDGIDWDTPTNGHTPQDRHSTDSSVAAVQPRSQSGGSDIPGCSLQDARRPQAVRGSESGADAHAHLDFVRIALQNISRRNLFDRVETVLQHARPYYVDVRGITSPQFEEIEREARTKAVKPISPSIEGDQTDYIPDKLRRSYLEISKRRAEDVASIVDIPGTQVHEFLWNQVQAAAKEFLTHETIWRMLKLEDNLNDFFVSLFRMRMAFLGWHVSDQSRGGISESGHEAGERDWLLTNPAKDGDVALFEALRLSYLDRTKIESHLNKLIQRYNPQGLTNLFCIICYEGKALDDFWTSYAAYVNGVTTIEGLTVNDSWDESPASALNLKSLLVRYEKDHIPVFVRHVAMLVPKGD